MKIVIKSSYLADQEIISITSKSECLKSLEYIISLLHIIFLHLGKIMLRHIPVSILINKCDEYILGTAAWTITEATLDYDVGVNFQETFCDIPQKFYFICYNY